MREVCVHWKIIPISRLAARPGLPFQIINWLFQIAVTMVTSFGCRSPGNNKYYLVSGLSVDPDKTRAASNDQGNCTYLNMRRRKEYFPSICPFRYKSVGANCCDIYLINCEENLHQSLGFSFAPCPGKARCASQGEKPQNINLKVSFRCIRK